jgi:hypothetical protein
MPAGLSGVRGVTATPAVFLPLPDGEGRRDGGDPRRARTFARLRIASLSP